MRFKSCLHAASASVLAFAAQSPASAQSPSPAPAEVGNSESSAVDGEIMVVARRREERLQDVPISVVAIGGADLAERGVVSALDLQNAVAGVKVEPQNNKTSTPQITIRGQRQYGVLAAQDPPTTFYFADAPIASIAGLNSAMYDLESVQVLKGPQGTLFGKNTTGGAVLIVPAKPTDQLEGSATLRLGNYSARGFEGFANLPVADNLAIRLSAYVNDHAGYYRYDGIGPQTGLSVYDDHVLDLRFSAMWRPTSSIENYFVGYYSKTDSSGIPVALAAVNPNGALAATYGINTALKPGFLPYSAYIWDGKGKPDIYTDAPQDDHVDLYGFVNTTTFDIGADVTIKNILSYRNVENQSYLAYTGSPNPALFAYQNEKSHAWSEEFQLSGELFGGRVNWISGLFYQNYVSAQEQSAPVLYNNPATAFVFAFNTRSKNSSYAGYAQFTAKLTDKLSFTAGGRYTRDERKVDYLHQPFDRYSTLLGIPLVPQCRVFDDNGVRLPLSACSLKVKKAFEEPTYTLTMDYKVAPGLLVYASQRTGYRTGGFNQRAFTKAQRIPFKAENELSREIGIKSNFDIGAMPVRANIALYRDRYTDIQKNISGFVDGAPVASTFNAAAGVVKGVEFEGQIMPLPGLTLGLNYAYTDTGYEEFPVVISGTIQDFSDREYAGVPKNQYVIFGSYDFPIDPEAGKLTLSGSFSHQGSSFISEAYQSNEDFSVLYTAAQLANLPADNQRAYKLRSYDLVDARLRWSDILGSRFSAAVWVRNLTDEVAETFANPSYEAQGNVAVGFGPPRTYGLEVTMKFR